MIVLHRGKCGDLIALCAWLKERHSQEKVHLYIKEHRSFHKDNVQWIAPLLLQQPYIEKVGICQKISDVEPVKDIPCNLQMARKEALENKSYTGWWVDEPSWWQSIGADRSTTDLRDRFPVAYNEPVCSKEPWLEVPSSQRLIKEPYIVVSATPRYGCMNDLTPVMEYAKTHKIIFLGHQQYWRAFLPWSLYGAVKSSVQAAQLVRDCDLFVGTQTLHAWLAQSQGVNRIFSVSPRLKDTTLRVEKGFKEAVQSREQLKEALLRWNKL